MTVTFDDVTLTMLHCFKCRMLMLGILFSQPLGRIFHNIYKLLINFHLYRKYLLT